MTLDGARRDLAVLSVRSARLRHDTLLSVVDGRAEYELVARRIRMMLAVVEPLVIAIEALLTEPAQ